MAPAVEAPARKLTRTERFWRIIGGRKQANGYIYAVLVTVMVFVLGGTFNEYAMWLAASLLGTSLIVAQEDQRAGRKFPQRRSSDPPSPPPTDDGALG